MLSVEPNFLLRRLNDHCQRSFYAAIGMCNAREHYEVTIDHLLHVLVEDSTADIAIILRNHDIDQSRLLKTVQASLEQCASGNRGKPELSQKILECVQESWLLASLELGLTKIRSGVLLASLLSQHGRYLLEQSLEVLSPIRSEDLRRKFFEITAGSSEEEKTKESKEHPAKKDSPSYGEDTALGRFTINFTARAKANEIDPVFGRDREIRQMIDILGRRRKNNPICVGEAGVGKTAVVEGLALRVAQGDVPDILKDVEILSLDLGRLQAGAGVKGEFENRLKSVITDVSESPKRIIMFIDEAHTLIGAGGEAGKSDAANLLKPALARGELSTIAATTWAEYKKHFETDEALARRFQPIALGEPSEEDTRQILIGLSKKYEHDHQVLMTEPGLKEAARMARRYITGRQLPDKAVDLMDTAAARVKISLTSHPAKMEDVSREIQSLQREQAACQRDSLAGHGMDSSRMQELQKTITDLESELTALEKKWLTEKEAVEHYIAIRDQVLASETPQEEKDSSELSEAKEKLQQIQGKEPLMYYEVGPDVIAKVVSDWTGIPVGKMAEVEAQSILDLPGRIKERIKGQDTAIDALGDGIRPPKAEVGNLKGPMGVFLLVGPSGVGKTETALCLADLLFGGEDFMVTINMSEFQEKHTVSRLIGAPPGYKGYGEGGVLTEAIRQRPYSVVLLDEVEKSDLAVMKIFYQVFDKGMLTDGTGRVIDFKNTIILMTSNLGSKKIMELCAKGNTPSAEELTTAIRPLLSNHFEAALLARMDIVPYYQITPEALEKITILKTQQLIDQLKTTHGIELTIEPAVIKHVVQRCTEVETGARNIDHIMKRSLLPKLSTIVLEGMTKKSMPTHLVLTRSSQGEFQFESKGIQEN